MCKNRKGFIWKVIQITAKDSFLQAASLECTGCPIKVSPVALSKNEFAFCQYYGTHRENTLGLYKSNNLDM